MASFNFEANCHNITIKRRSSAHFSQDPHAHKISNNLILSPKQHTQSMLNIR